MLDARTTCRASMPRTGSVSFELQASIGGAPASASKQALNSGQALACRVGSYGRAGVRAAQPTSAHAFCVRSCRSPDRSSWALAEHAASRSDSAPPKVTHLLLKPLVDLRLSRQAEICSLAACEHESTAPSASAHRYTALPSVLGLDRTLPTANERAQYLDDGCTDGHGTLIGSHRRVVIDSFRLCAAAYL